MLYYFIVFIIIAASISLGVYISAPKTVSLFEIPQPGSSDPSPTPPPNIRNAFAAGDFYPKDKTELISTLTQFLQNSKPATISGKPRLIIAPHAGLNYSGQTAAQSYRQLQGHSYSQVVIISANHFHNYKEIAIYPDGFWQTPLGRVPVNTNFNRSLIDPSLQIKADTSVFSKDHTLEMQLIYLQQTLSDFSIVPILIGQATDATILNFTYKLAGLFDENTLVVISTDWSHYPPAQLAQTIDQTSISAFLSMDTKTFATTVKQLESKHAQQNLQTAACGFQALGIALELAKLLQIDQYHLLDYSNSSHTTNDSTRVVGYAAIAGWSHSLPSTTLDQAAQTEAITIARQAIANHLTNTPAPPYTPQNQILNFPLGAFVTLKKGHDLRGCIGHFEPAVPLYRVIQQSAIDAAVNDRRFSPVNYDELPQIDLEVSVLTPKRKVTNWQDIRLGIDGVVIQKGTKSGTFLPQVATEASWTLEQFLQELCTQKAILPPSCYQDPTVNLFTFQAQVFSE